MIEDNNDDTPTLPNEESVTNGELTARNLEINNKYTMEDEGHEGLRSDLENNRESIRRSTDELQQQYGKDMQYI
jgi:hypothetical protein